MYKLFRTIYPLKTQLNLNLSLKIIYHGHTDLYFALKVLTSN